MRAELGASVGTPRKIMGACECFVACRDAVSALSLTFSLKISRLRAQCPAGFWSAEQPPNADRHNVEIQPRRASKRIERIRRTPTFENGSGPSSAAIRVMPVLERYPSLGTLSRRYVSEASVEADTAPSPRPNPGAGLGRLPHLEPQGRSQNIPTPIPNIGSRIGSSSLTSVTAPTR